MAKRFKRFKSLVKRVWIYKRRAGELEIQRYLL